MGPCCFPLVSWEKRMLVVSVHKWRHLKVQTCTSYLIFVMLDISCLFSPPVKMKWVAQLCPTLCDPKDYRVHGFSRQPRPSPGYLPNPGIKPRSPTLQADSLPAELQGKPKNAGVGSPSLHQQIFPTQELHQGLLHCRLNKNSLTVLGWTSKRICTSLGLKFSRVLLYLFRKLTRSYYPEVIKPSKLNSHKFEFMRLLKRKKKTTMDT